MPVPLARPAHAPCAPTACPRLLPLVCGRTFFTVPETLLAGAPAMVYFNKRRSWGFGDQPNVKLHYGFNDWSTQVRRRFGVRGA